MKVIMDVFPMTNIRFTGIPQMTWHLAKRFKNEPGFTFAIGHRILDEDTLESLIELRSGLGLADMRHGGESRFLGLEDVRSSIYFSPHQMSLQTRYGRGSVRIIHDISTITHPEFHHPETLDIDRRQIATQAALCRRIITVSESSKREIVGYLGLPDDKVVVASPGVSWNQGHLHKAGQHQQAFPYALVLGTREPRKNLRLVLAYLERYQSRVRSSGRRFVIAGPTGWGLDDVDQASENLKSLINDGWVKVLGHVREEDKLSLIAGADFLIAPSITEGFGSPPAEALALAVPVVSSLGGSLPGTVKEAGYYFDPFEVDSLATAIDDLQAELLVDPVGVRSRAWAQGMEFSWEECARTIYQTLEDVWQEGPGDPT